MAISHLIAEISESGSGFFCDDSKLVTSELGDKILDEHSRIFAQRKDFVKRDLCTAFIPRGSRAGPNKHMDKHQCRKQWLRALREREGSISALASRLETDPNYLSSLLGPSSERDVGDELARRAEQAYQLPAGVLDLPSEGIQKLVDAAAGLDDQAIQEVLDFIKYKKSLMN